jgi:hypothetical protein
MIDVALKMLFGERAKYAMLVSGIGFATILMTQGMALFFGILGFSYATMQNIRAPIWVVDPLVQQAGDNQPLRDTDIDRVRSVEGVAWAAPLFVGIAQARLLEGGATQPVMLVGLDLGVSGQTFYTFVLENTRHLGVLKAMGASKFRLAAMILTQAGIVGFVGFGLGVGVMSAFFSIQPEGRAPMTLLWQIPVIVFCAITLICMVSAVLSLWRVAAIEPAIVFRA